MNSSCSPAVTALSRRVRTCSITPLTSAVFPTSRRPRPLYEPEVSGNNRGRKLAADTLSPHGPPRGGDVAVFKFGRCFAHGVIVVSWPRLIHAWCDAGVVYADADQAPLIGRLARFFDPFPISEL